MARKSFSVLFFIKKAKLLKNGEAPVCMRITVNGCMVDISIKRSCPVKNRKTFCNPPIKRNVDFLQALTQNEMRFFI